MKKNKWVGVLLGAVSAYIVGLVPQISFLGAAIEGAIFNEGAKKNL